MMMMRGAVHVVGRAIGETIPFSFAMILKLL